MTKPVWSHVLALSKVKSCYNPLRLGTVIVLISSGIDFVKTPLLYSDQDPLIENAIRFLACTKVEL